MTKFKGLVKSVFHKFRSPKTKSHSSKAYDGNEKQTQSRDATQEVETGSPNVNPGETSSSVAPSHSMAGGTTELSEVESDEQSEAIDPLPATMSKLDDSIRKAIDIEVQKKFGDPLKDKHIRLLHILPGSGEDPIICSLTIRPLKGKIPPFEAVSYVWGSEDNPHPITCNWASPLMDTKGPSYASPFEIKKNMTVTDNLYRLLLRLREPNCMRALWIDQICIDQDTDPSKLQEKMAQVRVMAEIYSAATSVIIWLGEEDSETATAFGMMKWMAATCDMSESDMCQLISYLSSRDNFLDDRMEDPEQHQKTMDNLKSLLNLAQPAVVLGAEDTAPARPMYVTFQGFEHFGALLQKSWFGRSWTFQESISAQQATVVCGSHIVTWDILFKACKSSLARHMFVGDEEERIETVFSMESLVKKGELQRDWARLNSMPGKMYSLSEKNKIGLQEDLAWITSGAFMDRRKLKKLLPLLRPTACKDPRDKVLALLGIAHDDLRKIEFPTYEYPVMNLYTSVVSYWVWGREKLDISFLNHVQDSNPAHNLPSWVPDWSVPVTATPLIDLAEFSASGDSTAEMGMDEIDYFSDLDKFPYFPPIMLEGFSVLKIADVERDMKHIERFEEMLGSFENPYPTTKMSYEEAWKRTLFPDVTKDFLPLEREEDVPSFWVYTNARSASPSAFDTTPISPSPPPLPSSTSATSSRLHKLAAFSPSTEKSFNATAQKHARSPLPGRAFFTTTTGFIGLCPLTTVPGDEVFIFMGGATPFVLNMTPWPGGGEMIRFVGECFVLGLMHGEAMVGLRERERKSMVVIR